MATTSGEATLGERWITSRAADTVERATSALERLDLGGYLSVVYDFAWNDFCDWFLEVAKVELRREDASAGDRGRVWRRAGETLAEILKLLHPIMPLITEAIWDSLRAADPDVTGPGELLVAARWPSAGKRDRGADIEFGALQQTVRAVRNARLESGLPAGLRLPLELLADSVKAAARAEHEARSIEALARVRPLVVHAPGSTKPPDAGAIPTPFGPAWLQSDESDGDAQRPRHGERERLSQSIGRLTALLANGEFTGKAPAEVVERERARLGDLEEALRQLGG